MLFALSLTLNCLGSGIVAQKLGDRLGHRFWLFLSVTSLQLGLVAVVTSLIGCLTPSGWIAVQALLLLPLIYWYRPWQADLSLTNVRPYLAKSTTEFTEFIQSLSPLSLAALFCTLAFLATSAITQFQTPLSGFDERMYHASRVIYWLQHLNLFPYETHNDRQTVFNFGAELFFLWPVLFTRSELIARMLFWLGYPAAAIGIYLVLRAMKFLRGTAIAGTLLLVSTPIFTYYSIGLKPEMWSAVFLLGVAYWAVQVCILPSQVRCTHFFLAASLVQAINIRPQHLALFPCVMLIPFLVRGRSSFVIRCSALAAGLIVALFASGLLVTFGYNWASHGHLLGPTPMREVHQSELSNHQLYTHAVRFPFLLLELPSVPSPEIRARVSNLANAFIESVGAGKPLVPEADGDWPGRFAYALPERAQRFSAPGILWLPTIIVALLQCIRNLMGTFPSIKIPVTSALTLLVIPSLAVNVFVIRWMAGAGMPDRSLIGPYVLSVCIGVALIAPLTQRSRWWSCITTICIGWTVFPSAEAIVRTASAATFTAPFAASLDAPFSEPLNHIGCGARILFIGSQNAPDYPLFRPRDYYCNQVVSWGKSPFAVQKMTGLIKSRAITHVLIQNDHMVSFHWYDPIQTGPMVNWFSSNPEVQAIPLATPHMRLFVTNKSAQVKATADPVIASRAPAQNPLIFVDQSLDGKVGIEPTIINTPWAIEQFGPSGQGFLWVGAQLSEGLQFALWARKEIQVNVRFDVSPGLSGSGIHRALFLGGDMKSEDRRPIDKRQLLEFRIKLNPGRNIIKFWTDDQPTKFMQPNGDTRHLMIALHHVLVLP